MKTVMSVFCVSCRSLLPLYISSPPSEQRLFKRSPKDDWLLSILFESVSWGKIQSALPVVAEISFCDKYLQALVARIGAQVRNLLGETHECQVSRVT